ncbi:MAG TPA: hypothetical protein VJN94_14105 [Candidatus Binataceae bacterium]|nr:hypothetical protein [Candidatus Binataceae bacterium]
MLTVTVVALMARKKKEPRHSRVSDEELIAKLEDEAEHILTVTMPEELFHSVIKGLLNDKPLSDEVPHFYCRKCGEYHLKTHPHNIKQQSTKPTT